MSEPRDVRQIPNYYRCERHQKPGDRTANASSGLECNECCNERDEAVDALVLVARRAALALERSQWRDEALTAVALRAALAPFDGGTDDK